MTKRAAAPPVLPRAIMAGPNGGGGNIRGLSVCSGIIDITDKLLDMYRQLPDKPPDFFLSCFVQP